MDEDLELQSPPKEQGGITDINQLFLPDGRLCDSESPLLVPGQNPVGQQIVAWEVARKIRISITGGINFFTPEQRAAFTMLLSGKNIGEPAPMHYLFPPYPWIPFCLKISVPISFHQLPLPKESIKRSGCCFQCKESILGLISWLLLIYQIAVVVMVALMVWIFILSGQKKYYNWLNLNPRFEDNKYGLYIFSIRLFNYGYIAQQLLLSYGKTFKRAEAYLLKNGYEVTIKSTISQTLRSFFLLDWISAVLLLAGLKDDSSLQTWIICCLHVFTGYWSFGYFRFSKVVWGGPANLWSEIQITVMDLFYYNPIAVIVNILVNILIVILTPFILIYILILCCCPSLEMCGWLNKLLESL